VSASGNGEGVAAGLLNEFGGVGVRKPDFVETHSLARRGRAAGGGGGLGGVGPGHEFSLARNWAFTCTTYGERDQPRFISWRVIRAAVTRAASPELRRVGDR